VSAIDGMESYDDGPGSSWMTLLIGRHADGLARWPWRGRKAKHTYYSVGRRVIILRPRALASTAAD
jgi:hypothetical protein